MMTPHGPATEVFEKASEAQLLPMKVAQGDLVSTQHATYSYLNVKSLESQRTNTWLKSTVNTV